MNDVIDLCFVVESNEKFEVLCEDGCEKLYELEYSEEEEDVLDMDEVDVEEIEKGYLILGDGYRGEVCYDGYVKYKGSWWYCDFVNEGLMYKVEEDCDEVRKML